jgi:hypothetical protein
MEWAVVLSLVLSGASLVLTVVALFLIHRRWW